MKSIKGMVGAVSQKDKGYSVKIGEEWFSGFGKCPYSKGQDITLNYEDKEGNGRIFHNIKNTETDDIEEETVLIGEQPQRLSFIDISIMSGQAGNQTVQILMTQPAEVQRIMKGDMDTYVRLTEYFFKANNSIKQQLIKEYIK